MNSIEPPESALDIPALVAARRAKLKELSNFQNGYFPEGSERMWGLALSGGGIRSATFCLGLLRAIAQKGLLLRFDLLSSVSGGGYSASMLGRLFSRAEQAQDVERIQSQLGDSQIRWFMWWLRANGRYLVPAGVKDMAFAAALYLRNFIGVHVELGLLSLTLGIGLVAIDLLAWWASSALGFTAGRIFFDKGLSQLLAPWLPSAWLLLALPIVAGAVQIAAYWDIGWLSRASRRRTLGLWFTGLAFVVVYALGPLLAYQHAGDAVFGNGLRLTLWLIILFLSVVWLMGVPLAVFRYERREPPQGEPAEDYARNRLTSSLATTFKWAMLILLAGVADRAAWFLAFEKMDLVSFGFFLFMAAAIMRALLPLAAKIGPGRAGSAPLLLAGRCLGYALTFFLCVWWISLLHKSVLGAIFRLGYLDFAYGWSVLAIFALPIGGYLLLTGYNVGFLNLSSLHGFYRARLSRSYLGAANVNRFHTYTNASNPLGALDHVPPQLSSAVASHSVNDVVKLDDIGMNEYLPHRSGGPLHLINVCVNQSKDPRGGQFNQDRRGQIMTIAGGGAHRVSLGAWKGLPIESPLTLASWTAISGAAVAPGLGSMTRGGISALAMFAGVRTGYWWEAATRVGIATRPWQFSVQKSIGMLRETFGAFLAGESDSWFLSDGGHFENTGAYALLAERAEVIVVADCGADPDYRFEDLENLVRKARIDLCADVLFQRPKHVDESIPGAPAKPSALSFFGSVNDLASAKGTACLALAKVIYHDGSEGILIVVKPNICRGLPVDLINFKAKHPAFPQQTTVDQFFSEAQWESYHQLGRFLGHHLDKQLLENLLRHAGNWFDSDDCSLQAREEARHAAAPVAESGTVADEPEAASQESRLPARITATAAIKATLSLGAAATVGVAAWQAIDSARASYAKQVLTEREALKDLADKWMTIGSGGTSDENVRAVSALAGALLQSADTLCPANEAGWFQKSALARSIVDSGLHQCQALQERRIPSETCRRLLDTANPALEPVIPWCLRANEDIAALKVIPPNYWGYSYAKTAKTISLHPCDPVRGDRAAAQASSPVKDRDETEEERQTNPSSRCAQDWRDASRVAASQASSAPQIAVSAAPNIPAKVTTQECKGKTIYILIYGQDKRDVVRAKFREPWRALGASVPPIEDVWATARSNGRALPTLVPVTTIRMHDLESIKCVDAMKASLDNPKDTANWKVEPLPSRLKTTPGTLEVWVSRPPRAPLQTEW